MFITRVVAAGGVTTLMLAAARGHAGAVRALHALRAGVCAADAAGRTALMRAAAGSHAGAVAAGAVTTLMLAAAGGHAGTVLTLHALRAGVCAANAVGRPLGRAVLQCGY